MKHSNSQSAFTPIGFTLAELLIALAILGVIATFTIPKILDSGSNSKNNAIAKEVAGTFSGAFQNYKLSNTVSNTTTLGDLTPYINYVSLHTTNSLDGHTGAACNYAVRACSGTDICLRLHNGSIVRYDNTIGFNDINSTTSAIWFMLDPDGQLSGASNEAGHAVYFYLYVNGRIRTQSDVEANTYSDGTSYQPNASCDPTWFSWSN